MDALVHLAEIVARHGASGTTVTALPGVTVMAATEPTAPISGTTRPSLALVAGGAKRTVVGDRELVYGAGQHLVVTLEVPVISHICAASAQEPFLAIGVTLDPSAIATLLLETPGARAGGTVPGIEQSVASLELIDALVRVLRLLDTPADIPALWPAYQREILWRLISGPSGAAVRQIGLADSALSHIARAIGWISAHHAQTLRIDDLAELSGMSPSTFHRSFRAATSMTPIAFQKHIRLNRARAQLLANPDDVAGAGFAVGYNSPSQFSREYSRMFGRPPSQDIEQLRDEVADVDGDRAGRYV